MVVGQLLWQLDNDAHGFPYKVNHNSRLVLVTLVPPVPALLPVRTHYCHHGVDTVDPTLITLTSPQDGAH